jgi:membrane protease YdiL (CAAX protease family)
MALIRPSRRDIVIGLACIVVLLPLGDLASYLTGRDIVPPFVVNAYKLARDNGTLVPLAIAFTIAAPFMEEFIFRGFLFRGFSASRVGVAGGVVIASLCWAAMHVQYELFFLVQIFLLGLVFGWLRWRSGSLVLTLGLHALINFSALIQTAIIVERMS